jgi:hypothetical protein
MKVASESSAEKKSRLRSGKFTSGAKVNLNAELLVDRKITQIGPRTLNLISHVRM